MINFELRSKKEILPDCFPYSKLKNDQMDSLKIVCISNNEYSVSFSGGYVNSKKRFCSSVFFLIRIASWVTFLFHLWKLIASNETQAALKVRRIVTLWDSNLKCKYFYEGNVCKSNYGGTSIIYITTEKFLANFALDLSLVITEVEWLLLHMCLFILSISKHTFILFYLSFKQ